MEGGPPRFQRGFSCPAVLRCQSHSLWLPFAYGALTLSRGPSQTASATCSMQTGLAPSGPYNPEATRTSVWAGPVSLAATPGISVDFFSWGYLDVSVLPVGPDLSVTAHDGRRVAPFGYPGITACVRLPRDYRGLPRPSSPVRAKASTVRPFFAWPDYPPAPLESPPIPLEEQTHTSDTPLVLTFPSTLPIPELSIKPEYRGVLCVVQPPHRNGGRSASRAFVQARSCSKARPRVTRRSKGGDPAAGSPTATLLRLRPSHRARLRRLPPLARLGHRLRALPTSMA